MATTTPDLHVNPEFDLVSIILAVTAYKIWNTPERKARRVQREEIKRSQAEITGRRKLWAANPNRCSMSGRFLEFCDCTAH
jgi:hypothetical protein